MEVQIVVHFMTEKKAYKFNELAVLQFDAKQEDLFIRIFSKILLYFREKILLYVLTRVRVSEMLERYST